VRSGQVIPMMTGVCCHASGHDFSRAFASAKVEGFSPCHVETFTVDGPEQRHGMFSNILSDHANSRRKISVSG
jgi:hypothetical protein